MNEQLRFVFKMETKTFDFSLLDIGISMPPYSVGGSVGNTYSSAVVVAIGPNYYPKASVF